MIYSVDMKRNPKKYHRRSIRLAKYDYSKPGAYFVTVATYRRRSFFGEIINDAVSLNAYGRITYSCWEEISEHFDNVRNDVFVVMPNHIHGILFLEDTEGTAFIPFGHAVPLRVRGMERNHLAGR